MAEKLSAKSAWKLNNALKKSAATRPTKVGTARVTRRDSDGSMWVRLPGSNVDTPVNGQVLSDAAVGDTVSVRIENGRLSLMGNASTPAVGQQQVNTTVQPVSRQATYAMQAAELATTYATEAQASAALADALAREAGESAYTANLAAEGALLGLSTVEDVVNVVDWLAAHCTTTTDTEVVAGVSYYVRDAGTGAISYRVPESADEYSPLELGWLEAVPTEDTEAVEGKTYYELDDETGELTPVAEVPSGADPSALGWLEVTATADGSIAEGKAYYHTDPTTGDVTPVPDPIDPSAFGWVVLTEAVTEYVGSHLAQTDHGLNVMVDGQSGHIHIGTLDGEHEYGTYIVGEDGVPEASFGEHTRIGREDGMHVDITSDPTSNDGKLFSIANGGADPVMYVQVDSNTGESTVYMTNAVVVQDLRFGNWMWYERTNGNMSVRWTGDDA